MRKLYLLSTLIFTLIVLVGCGKKYPMIQIEDKEVTINVNEAYNLMDGVTAIDRKKNDLTDSVQIDAGSYKPYYEGEYTITYSVEDQNGKVGEATRIIKVVDQLRSQNAPVLSNPEDIVLEFNQLKITKNDLYQQLKEVVGLQTLLETIDLALFKDYEIDEAEYDTYFNGLVEYYGEAEFLEIMKNVGFYHIESEETKDEFMNRIKQYLSLTYLKKQAVHEYAISQLTVEEVNNALTNYREDLCVINLKYKTKTEVTNALAELTNYTGEKVDYFKTKYGDTKQNETDSYLNSQLNCEYDRVVYLNQTNATYRDTLFNDLNVGEYTTNYLSNNNEYYLSYVLAEANANGTYDRAKFEEEIREILASKKLTNDYIKQTVNQIRLNKGLKIYDPLLASQYQSTDSQFSVSEMNQTNVVASYNGIDLTVDAFYDILKSRYGATQLLNTINLEALKSINEIAATDEDMEYANSTVANLKSQYEYYYAKTSKYTEFLIGNFGVSSEDELKDLIILDILSSRYILGYNNHTGLDPILSSEIDDAFDNYFNVKASHILFTFTDDASEEIALTKANQILRGVNSGEEAYITLNGESFGGLNNLQPDEVVEIFGQLAATFSEDTGSKVKNGDLGYFTPGVMVKEFEDEARKLAKDQADSIGSFSDAPVKSQFGYHILLITDVKTPTKPSDYDNYTEAQLNEIVTNNLSPEIVAYYNIESSIKANLEKEKLTFENVEKYLSELRDRQNITIQDETINKHYQALN